MIAVQKHHGVYFIIENTNQLLIILYCFDLTNGTATNAFKFKDKIAGQTSNNGTKNAETMVSLKYLRNSLTTL